MNPESRRPVVPPPVGAGRDTRARREARQALVDVLWAKDGTRRLPRERELSAAIAACDARDVWWVCEANSAGPLYLLPTREWIAALAKTLDALGVRSVLEIAAGDGFLSACLQRARPKLVVRASDDGSWGVAARRQSAADRRAYKGVSFAGISAGAHVEKASAVSAIRRYTPDLVLVAWAPPGTLVERAIRAPCRYVLDVSVDGDVCGAGDKTWCFHKEFLDGPVEERALCRLDSANTPRTTRVTLYFGARHAEHGVDKIFQR